MYSRFIQSRGANMQSMLTFYTFSFLGWVTAHRPIAVKAISFDTVQTKHLGVLSNALYLILDPVQCQHFTLCYGLGGGAGRNKPGVTKQCIDIAMQQLHLQVN